MAGGRRVVALLLLRAMRYRIIYRDTATKKFYVFRNIDTGNKLYYRFPVPVSLPDGEYQYYIIQNWGRLALDENDIRKSTIDGKPLEVYDEGVAWVGIPTRQITAYNSTKNYKFYEN